METNLAVFPAKPRVVQTVERPPEHRTYDAIAKAGLSTDRASAACSTTITATQPEKRSRIGADGSRGCFLRNLARDTLFRFRKSVDFYDLDLSSSCKFPRL